MSLFLGCGILFGCLERGVVGNRDFWVLEFFWYRLFRVGVGGEGFGSVVVVLDLAGGRRG